MQPVRVAQLVERGIVAPVTGVQIPSGTPTKKGGEMRVKGFFPHKGRAFLEPDGRIVDFVRAAAVLHRTKQDEILAAALLSCFEDEKDGPLVARYAALAKGYSAGEFKRRHLTKAKTQGLGVSEVPALPAEETVIGPVSPDIRVEWDAYLKGVA